MAKQIEFQVSKRGGVSTVCQFNAPENLEDPRWGEVVSNPQEDINELALQNLVIKIQAGAREKLEEEGATAAQEYVNSYKYGARQGGGFRRPTVAVSKAKEVGFSEEQMAFLRAAGVRFENDTTAEPEAEPEAVGAEA